MLESATQGMSETYLVREDENESGGPFNRLEQVRLSYYIYPQLNARQVLGVLVRLVDQG
jgi:hypothetical protein